jgi:hypothetical protein
MWSLTYRHKLEANYNGDQTVDFLSLGERHEQLLAKA